MNKKILILSHKFYPSIGGIETFSEILAEFFLKAGNQVHVLTWSSNAPDKYFPYEVIRKPNLKALTREIGWADIVFENNPCLRLSWPNVFYNRPSVVVLQTWLPDIKGIANLSRRSKFWWLKRSKQVVAISDAVRKRCWSDAIIIPNSYNTETFKDDPEIPRTKDFVFVGRLVSDKGVDIAIKAIHLLNNDSSINTVKDVKYNLTIIGEGPDQQKLEELILNLGLQSQIRLTGALREKKLATCLNKHKYLLVPSLWEEPFGIVALEGMACGCIPIVSDGGGLPDAVGDAGLTFKRGDEYSLLASIKSILQDTAKEESLRKTAKSHLSAHHPQAITDKYLNLIEEITSNYN